MPIDTCVINAKTAMAMLRAMREIDPDTMPKRFRCKDCGWSLQPAEGTDGSYFFKHVPANPDCSTTR